MKSIHCPESVCCPGVQAGGVDVLVLTNDRGPVKMLKLDSGGPEDKPVRSIVRMGHRRWEEHRRTHDHWLVWTPPRIKIVHCPGDTGKRRVRFLSPKKSCARPQQVGQHEHKQAPSLKVQRNPANDERQGGEHKKVCEQKIVSVEHDNVKTRHQHTDHERANATEKNEQCAVTRAPQGEQERDTTENDCGRGDVTGRAASVPRRRTSDNRSCLLSASVLQATRTRQRLVASVGERPAATAPSQQQSHR